MLVSHRIKDGRRMACMRGRGGDVEGFIKGVVEGGEE